MHGKKTGALIRAIGDGGRDHGRRQRRNRSTRSIAPRREFGLAFQIVDDILDVEGASAELGKTAGKDAAAGKPTYPQLYGLDAVAADGRASACRAPRACCLPRHLADAHLLGIGRWIVERSK